MKKMMTVNKLKKELANLSQKEMIDLVANLYTNHPLVAQTLDLQFVSEKAGSAIVEDYKKTAPTLLHHEWLQSQTI